MKIGLLGGTFNPVHCGHLRIASSVQKVLGMEKIVFIPSAHPPHKSERGLPSPKDRYEMVKLAIRKYPRFSISNVELKQKGKSWTINTVHVLKKLYHEAQIYFIIGADTLPEIPTWKNYKKLLKSCRFVIVNRPGYSITDCGFQNADFIEIKIRGVDISSTQIRKKVKDGIKIKNLVPAEVEKYIKKKGLYRQ